MHFDQFSHVTLQNQYLAQLTTAFGAQGIKISKTADFIPALKKSFDVKDRPTIIVVSLDYRKNMKLFHHLKESVKL
jgi:thiamine pyrophosphate-dependent acetolactate synthase large subunit-like protein